MSVSLFDTRLEKEGEQAFRKIIAIINTENLFFIFTSNNKNRRNQFLLFLFYTNYRLGQYVYSVVIFTKDTNATNMSWPNRIADNSRNGLIANNFNSAPISIIAKTTID